MLRWLKCLPGLAFSAFAFAIHVSAQAPQPSQSGYYADDPEKSPPTTKGQPQQSKVADSAVTAGTPTQFKPCASP
jgi:hypothetical protein